MPKAVLSPPNAILFVFDPTSKDVEIPSCLDGELTASSSTCFSVGTQADIDGDTHISLDFGSVTPADLQRIFFGVINVPNGKVAVVTSQFERVLELNVPMGSMEVTIWADNLSSPGRIAVDVRCPPVLSSST